MDSNGDNVLKPPALPTTRLHARQDDTHSCIRVLLVDDHAMLRQRLRSIIEDCDHMEVVRKAGNGLEAIAVVPVSRPDVVVMDINMPKTMDSIPSK